MLYDILMRHLTIKEGAGFIPEYVVPYYNKKLRIEKILEDFKDDPLVSITLNGIKLGKGLKRILNYKIL